MDNDSGKVFIPRPVAAAMGSHKNILVMGTKRKVVRLTIIIKQIIPFFLAVNVKIVNLTTDFEKPEDTFLALSQVQKSFLCSFQTLSASSKDSSWGLNTKS